MTDHSTGKSPLAALAAFAASGLVATAAQFALRLGKNVLFTRLLGPEGRGLYSLLMTLPTLLVGFGNLGFGLGSLYLATREKADLRRLTGNALACCLVQGGLLVGVAALVFQLQGRGVFALDGAEAIRGPVLAATFLLLLYNLGIDLLTARTDIHYLNSLKLVFSLLPVAVLLALFFATGDAVGAALTSYLVSLGAVGVLAFYRLFRKGGWPPALSPRLAMRAFHFGLRGAPSQFANTVTRRVDVLFLAHFWGAEAVGQYAAAISLAEILLALPDAVATPFLPMRLAMDDEAGRRFSPLVLKYVLAVMAIVCAATAVCAAPAIFVLFGKDFSPSLAPLLWLLPGILALSAYDLAKTDILGLGRPGFLSLVSIAAMLLNLLLNALIIPTYGAPGAAFCSSVCYCAQGLALLTVVARATGTPLGSMLLVNRADLTILWQRLREKAARKRS